MPRLPIDYQKSLIYKLCCNNTDIKDIYIGSTTDFTNRKYCHKTSCNNPNNPNHNFKVYQYIRENYGWDNWSMILVENFPCENKLQLKQRERHWIDTLESKLNCQIPLQTQKERYVKNTDKAKKRFEVYYQKNKDEIKERMKEYRADNLEIIKEKQKEKITCECGCEITKQSLTRHLKSQKHLKLIKNLEKLKSEN